MHDGSSRSEWIIITEHGPQDMPQQVPSELECHLRGSNFVEARTIDSQQPAREWMSLCVPGQTGESGLGEVARESSRQRRPQLAMAVGHRAPPERFTKRNLERGQSGQR